MDGDEVRRGGRGRHACRVPGPGSSEPQETDAVSSRDVFDGGWPDAPVRTLDNSTLRDWRGHAGNPAPGSRPGEGDVIGHWSDGETIVRYDADLPGRTRQGIWKRWPTMRARARG